MKNQKNITYNNPQLAFENAIEKKRLSENEDALNFAGNYMYMFTQDGIDQFKHSIDRTYLQQTEETHTWSITYWEGQQIVETTGAGPTKEAAEKNCKAQHLANSPFNQWPISPMDIIQVN